MVLQFRLFAPREVQHDGSHLRSAAVLVLQHQAIVKLSAPELAFLKNSQGLVPRGLRFPLEVLCILTE